MSDDGNVIVGESTVWFADRGAVTDLIFEQTNGNDSVEPLDALLIINQLNAPAQEASAAVAIGPPNSQLAHETSTNSLVDQEAAAAIHEIQTANAATPKSYYVHTISTMQFGGVSPTFESVLSEKQRSDVSDIQRLQLGLRGLSKKYTRIGEPTDEHAVGPEESASSDNSSLGRFDDTLLSGED